MPLFPIFSVPLLVYLGYLASALDVVAYFMKAPRYLRQLAIASNVLFIVYGVLAHQYSVLVLHAVLLPLNVVRLAQLERQLRTIRKALRGEGSADWWQSFTERYVFEAGSYLFRKGDPSGLVFFIAQGTVRLVEIEHSVRAGQLLGEMAMFTPGRVRSLSALAETRVEVYAIGAEALAQLFHRNPHFGLYLVQLITRRLFDDITMLEGMIAVRNAELEGFRRLKEPA